MQGLGVLDLVVVLEFVAEDFLGVEGALRASVVFELAKASPMEERVSDRQMNRKVRRIAQAFDLANLERGEQQPKPGNGHGVGVEIHSANTIERFLRKNTWVLAGLMFQPEAEEPLKTS